MAGSKVNVDGLAKSVMDRLKDYKGVCSVVMEKAVNETAKETVKNIKDNAAAKFGGTGKYAKSWKVKKLKTKQNKYASVVHSPTHYRLTHLLENGHAKVGGGRVEGRPHIAPAEEKAAEMFERLIKEGIERG